MVMPQRLSNIWNSDPERSLNQVAGHTLHGIQEIWCALPPALEGAGSTG